MISELINNFNKIWPYEQKMDKEYLVEDTGSCYRIIIKNTCDWQLKSGGCTMCNYSDRTGIKANFIITTFQNLILDELISLNKNYDKLKFYINGSFFNDNELSFDVAISFINLLKDHLHLSKVCVESRPEFVNYNKLNKYILSTGLQFEICFGIESTNDVIRNVCFNKGVDIENFYTLLNDINALCDIKVYLLVKPPFLTEKQAIEDVVNSVNELLRHGVTNISFTPIAIQSNTILEFMLQEKLYRPVWIWSLIEINTRLKNVLLQYPNIHLSGLDYYPEPILSLFNCEKCTSDLLNILKRNRNLTWEEIDDNLKCNCYYKWKMEIESDKPSCSINNQIENVNELLNKNLQRTEQISKSIKSLNQVDLLTDIAKLLPAYKSKLDNVGIEDVQIPMNLVGYYNTIATCNYSIELDEFHRGIHMSRLVEILYEFSSQLHKDALKDLEDIIRKDNVNSRIELSCVLMKDKQSIISHKKSLISLSLNIKVQQKEEEIASIVEVSVPFINACPCTLTTANELFDYSFTHTQKGIIKISFCDIKSPLSKVLIFAEQYISIFDMLKREDEILVVKSAFDAAQFCEDKCRELSDKLTSAFSGLCREIVVKVTTDESIHPHRAFSEKTIIL